MKEFLQKTIREAGEMALEYFLGDLTIEDKTVDVGQTYDDLITEADKAVNAFFVDTIHAEYPIHTITSEEQDTVEGDSEYEWIIDPIDGTWDFAHQIPTWGIIVSLLRSGEPLYSAIYFPVSKQLFFADEEYSYFNDKKIKLHSTKRLDNCRYRLFTMKQHGPYGVSYDRFHKAINKFLQPRECMPKNFGGASSTVYLVTGGFEFTIANAGMDWDLVANAHIIRNAGGIVTDSHGKKWERGMQEFITASNETLHKEVLALFE